MTVRTEQPPDQRGLAGTITRVAMGNVAIPLASFATSPILAQELGVRGRGVVAAVMAPFLLVTVVAAFGLPDAITHYVARSDDDASVARRGFATLLLAGVVGTAIALLIAHNLGGLTSQQRHLAQLTCIFVIPTIFVAGLRGFAAGTQRWHLVNSERYLTAFLRLVAVAGLALLGLLTVTSSVLALVIGPVVAGACYLGGLGGLRLHRRRQVDEVAAVTRGALVGYGLRVWVGGISGVLLSRLDQVLMTPLAGPHELGIYVVAVNVSEVVLIANWAVRDVSFSTQSARPDDDALMRSSRLSLVVASVVGAVLAASGFLWIPLVFGSGFAPSAGVNVVLVAAAVIGVPGSVAGAGLSARGRPGLRSGCLVFATVLNVVAIFLLVPRWGAMGAAWATLVGNGVAGGLAVLFAWRLYGLAPRGFYLLRADDVRVLRGAVRRLALRARAG